MSKTVKIALDRVWQRIHQAEAQANRPMDTVQLIAVSKTFSSEVIREAYAAGQRAFGENYVQEFSAKAVELADLDIEWHFIGPIQSNKTHLVAKYAHWVHSVDRQKIAERLSAQRSLKLPALNLCIQVNVSGEESKHGCVPDAVGPLLRQIVLLPNVRVRGLMCIPEPTEDEVLLASRFSLLRDLSDCLKAEGFELDVLSMGMSADLALAVRQGATMVRVGTAIFGARDYS